MNSPRLCRRYAFGLPLAYIFSFLLGYKRKHLQNDVGYQRADEVFVAARITKRHVEDQNVHLLFARQDGPLFLNLFVVTPQSVYARNAELVAGRSFFINAR